MVLISILGSFNRLDSLAIETNINPEAVYSRSRTNGPTHREQILPVMPFGTTSVFHSLRPTSGEPQSGRSLNQAPRVPEDISQTLRESPWGRSGAGRTSSVLPSGQGGRAPHMPIPPETPRLMESPASTSGGGIDQTFNEIFLEEVVPGEGPVIGGIPIVILGENFPAVPLFVGFGNNWIRAVSHARYHSTYIDPKMHFRSGAAPLHFNALFLDRRT
jgi:hypothetical protein